MKPELWTRRELDVFLKYWEQYVNIEDKEPSWDDYHRFCSKINIMAEVAYSTYKLYVAAKTGSHQSNGRVYRLALRMKESEKHLGIKPIAEKKSIYSEYKETT